MTTQIEKILTKSIFTHDIVNKICGILAYDIIKKKCIEWINDPDTTIGMECNWVEYLIEKISINDLGLCKEHIYNALNVSSNEIAKMYINHEIHGIQIIYIIINDDDIIISTKYSLL